MRQSERWRSAHRAPQLLARLRRAARSDPLPDPAAIMILMSESLTTAQINDQFDGEWVLVENPQTDATNAVHGGTVLFHSKDRDEVYRKAIELRPKRFAMLYTGKMPENTA